MGLLALILAAAGWWWWNLREPVLPCEIYQGVIYACERLGEDERGGGLMHWTRIDLTTPGLDLYTTPLDSLAVMQGWEYHLRYVGEIVRANRLAVAVNGALFERAFRLPLPGAKARATETIVSAHQVNHIDPHSFLLWFDDDLGPHMEGERPPTEAVLKRARWGIGGNLRTLYQGQISPFIHDDQVNRRTLIGIDAKRKLLWLAVFERATNRRAAEELVRLGATDGVEVDGGSSTEMVLGGHAVGVRPGSLINTWVPTATHFGVQAPALSK